ncbi:hypothetical protein Q1695_011922 [Nippostrongylus brasiliensis]|nr:hypothetical protein Q1695_011922 [Nippostrongylus brasiliensis]
MEEGGVNSLDPVEDRPSRMNQGSCAAEEYDSDGGGMQYYIRTSSSSLVTPSSQPFTVSGSEEDDFQVENTDVSSGAAFSSNKNGESARLDTTKENPQIVQPIPKKRTSISTLRPVQPQPRHFDQSSDDIFDNKVGKVKRLRELFESRPNINQYTEERYNRALNSARAKIEQSFGVLKRQFHILHGECRYAPEKAAEITLACCILRNISIINRKPEDYDEYFGADGQAEDDRQEDGAVPEEPSPVPTESEMSGSYTPKARTDIPLTNSEGHFLIFLVRERSELWRGSAKKVPEKQMEYTTDNHENNDDTVIIEDAGDFSNTSRKASGQKAMVDLLVDALKQRLVSRTSVTAPEPNRNNLDIGEMTGLHLARQLRMLREVNFSAYNKFSTVTNEHMVFISKAISGPDPKL